MSSFLSIIYIIVVYSRISILSRNENSIFVARIIEQLCFFIKNNFLWNIYIKQILKTFKLIFLFFFIIRYTVKIIKILIILLIRISIIEIGEIVYIIFLVKKNIFFFFSYIYIQDTTFRFCSTKKSIFIRFFTKCSMLLSFASKTNTFISSKKEHVLLIVIKKNIFVLSTKLMFCHWYEIDIFSDFFVFDEIYIFYINCLHNFII